MSDPFEGWPLTPASKDDPRVESFRMLLAVVDRLRRPEDGCPWDLKQTEVSMGPRLVEEAYEWIEAIETGDVAESETEAGDTLMNLLLMCRIAQDGGRYDLGSVALNSAAKLVRRHPHVFGDAVETEAEGVLTRWEEIKRQERADGGQEDTSVLSGLPLGLPALVRTARMVNKTMSAGFRWSNVQGAWDKVQEELRELRDTLPNHALESERKPELSAEERENIESELGDLIAAAAILGEYLGLDPERACRLSARRFETRFRQVEKDLGDAMQGADVPTLEKAWQAAKVQIRMAREDA
ncbi:MAG: nucleoside triphosphate pyrophosphohydrolase [Planctomycetes bacterium]|nr:nucleoside triphosphate pyrophosphohydrolase [Planctomycetota bacterium]